MTDSDLPNQQDMKLREILSPSFQSLWLDIQGSPLYSHPTAMLWRNCLSINSQFCEAVVAAGYLSWEQMLHAASRYCLGASKNRGVIFWQVDHGGRVHDGKVMYYRPDCHRDKSKDNRPTWVSALLRRRERFPNAPHETSHCFFGLHLLTENSLKGLTEITEITERFKCHTALELCSLATEGTQESTESTERPKGHMERIPTDHA